MDARQHEDLIFTISQAILDARYAPPRRRRSAWGERFDEDQEQARRVAAAIVEAATTQRLPDLPQATGTPSQHAQGPVSFSGRRGRAFSGYAREASMLPWD